MNELTTAQKIAHILAGASSWGHERWADHLKTAEKILAMMETEPFTAGEKFFTEGYLRGYEQARSLNFPPDQPPTAWMIHSTDKIYGFDPSESFAKYRATQVKPCFPYAYDVGVTPLYKRYEEKP